MSPLSTSLFLGERLLARCADGLLEAELVLFGTADFVRDGRREGALAEAGYLTTAERALARLAGEGASIELSEEAAHALLPEVVISFAKCRSVRSVAGQLGPYELFEGSEYYAEATYYAGTWLDLRALGAALRLDGAARAMQALHLAAAFDEVAPDTPVFLASDEISPARLHQRVDLSAAFALPNALRVLRPNSRPRAPEVFGDERHMRDALVERVRGRDGRATTPALRAHFDALERALSVSGQGDVTVEREVERTPGAPTPPTPSPAPARAPWVTTVDVPVDTATPVLVESHVRPRPMPQGPLDPRLILLAEPNSARAASFRMLRDNLVAKGMPRVLAVSSPAPHDGKTTCAVNLALALAEHWSTKVLLVDANFYDPELAAIFAIDPPTPIARFSHHLHVAAIGKRSAQLVPSFDNAKFTLLIDRLCRTSYDHLIVDAPALSGSPVVAQLVAVADATLLAVRSGRTTAAALRRAVDQIPVGKALGVTLMDTDPLREHFQ